MNYDVFIPVRLESKRLAEKALLKINGKAIIEYLYERMQKVKKIRKVIVCTTFEKSDDQLVEYLKSRGMDYFRGSEKDILKRYLDASNKFDTDFIINVDGDDIYTDPHHVELIIAEFEKSNSDFIQMSNVPLGFTCMGFTKELLEKICNLKKTDDIETGWVRFFTETNVASVKRIGPIEKIKYPESLRLSLDYQEDFELSKEFFEKYGNNFDYYDIINYVISDKKRLERSLKTEESWNKHWEENLSDISLKDI